VADSGAYHRYNVIGDQTLCVGVLYTAEANFGLRAHYIGIDGGATAPLIKGLPWSRHGKVDLAFFD
jgi:hypothetical protein